MTMPSVRVSILRLLSVAVVLTVGMHLVGERFQQSLQESRLKAQNDWPTSLPHEANRIHAFNGTSFIAPEGWVANVGADSIELTSSQPVLNPSSFVIREVEDPFRHPRPLPRTHLYQETHACVKILHSRSTPYDPVRHEAHIILEHDARLYEISFLTYKKFTRQVPERIWNYLETFQTADSEALTASLN